MYGMYSLCEGARARASARRSLWYLMTLKRAKGVVWYEREVARTLDGYATDVDVERGWGVALTGKLSIGVQHACSIHTQFR